MTSQLVFRRSFSKCIYDACMNSFASLSFHQGKTYEDVREQPGAFLPAPPTRVVSSEERKQRWEAGQIDYMGADSFANIEQKLNSFLK